MVHVYAEASLASVLPYMSSRSLIYCGLVDRFGSPYGGVSTLITSAPNSVSKRVHDGQLNTESCQGLRRLQPS